MNYRIVERKEMTLVGLKLQGTYEELSKMPELWQTLSKVIPSITNKVGDHQESYGVYQDFPDMFVYYAGAQVSSVGELPDNRLEVITVPAHRYAVFTHFGSMDHLGNTMAQARSTMETEGLDVLDDAFKIELYDERFSPTSESSVMELYYPIES